ncbi:MAG TPA: META domain-containing protein [Chitinophagaceae bacterium]|nr:META domain-containing protein [Chitinophagaceae bacterium]
MKLISFISAGVCIIFSGFIMKKQSASLYEKKWLLKTIRINEEVRQVNTKAFIRFEEEKKSAGGNGSCNSFGGSVTVHENTIHFGNLISTKMYCEGAQEIENLFFYQLGKANQYSLDEKNLRLYHDKELLLEFISE